MPVGERVTVMSIGVPEETSEGRKGGMGKRRFTSLEAEQ